MGQGGYVRLATWQGVPLTEWMRRLDDSLPLSALTIPGTHDSYAYGVIRFAETQRMTVAAQLDAGIRFLDVRLRHFRDRMQLYHGRVNLNGRTFRTVQDDCLGFLERHPSESIIMSVKQEHTAEKNTESFTETFTRLLRNRERWYLENTMPSVREARGKIVLLRRFGDSGDGGLGIDASEWPDNTAFANKPGAVALEVQDRYDVGMSISSVTVIAGMSLTFGRKWDAVRAHLDRALIGQPATLFLNFASGASVTVTPDIVAKGSGLASGINSRLAEYVRSGEARQGRYGIIIMDYPEYPDDKLIGDIVGLNPR